MSDSSAYEKMDLFYLGREVDRQTGSTSMLPLLYKNKNFTTHAAIIGMTGSGKTGLGVCLLEEAAMDKIPAIVIDPKGDMGNLLLSFPQLRPDDFLPWVDDIKAEQKGISRKELAQETAATWEQGLQSWNQGRERIRRMHSNAEFVIYTPGAESGRPVSVLDSLEAPEPSVMEDNDTAVSLVGSTVSSILGLIGIQADPLKSREHILLSSIILHHWREGNDLSLEMLIGSVVNPAFDRIGVFPLESFYPQAKRMDLAMQLNNILASPAFSGWSKGDPLRIENLLYNAEGKPRINIFTIAHLSEPERMFFVTMLLGRLVSWMRRQEGSSGLRCLLYMDEIFGYFPPLGNPPSKKPMLMLLKQARAYGLGVVLATQNPVDLDYKGLSNIGTWFIGRLQTRQDQDRVMQGIAGSSDAKQKKAVRALLANMRGRTFLMYSAHIDEPVLFETRWVMSYLKGPISLAEIRRLLGIGTTELSGTDISPPEQIPGPSASGRQSTQPLLPGTISQCFVQMPIAVDDVTFMPWLAGRAKVRFYNQARNIDQINDVSLRLALDESFSGFEWSRSIANSVRPEETVKTTPAAAQFVMLPASFSQLKNLRTAVKSLSDHLYHSMALSLWRVPALKLESQPGESEGQFRQRVVDLLRERKESAVGKLEQRYQSKQKVFERRLEKVYARIEKEKGDVTARGIDTALSFGIAVFGALFGRKALSVSTASRSAQGMRNAGRVMKEKGDVKRAVEEAERIEAEIAALAQELHGKVEVVSDRNGQENFPLETFSISPRRADIFEVKVCVQWEPKLDLPPLM
jgi:hypothetical protein